MIRYTSDSVGNVILNDGAHRVVLGAELVRALAAVPWGDGVLRGEVADRMVVVALPGRCPMCGEPGEVVHEFPGGALGMECTACSGGTWVESADGKSP